MNEIFRSQASEGEEMEDIYLCTKTVQCYTEKSLFVVYLAEAY